MTDKNAKEIVKAIVKSAITLNALFTVCLADRAVMAIAGSEDVEIHRLVGSEIEPRVTARHGRLARYLALLALTPGTKNTGEATCE